MVDYEVKSADEYIHGGPSAARLMAHSKDTIEANSSDSFFSSFTLPDANVMLVGLVACLAVFVTVISVFMYHREKIRRIVTGENRRVGSVYYVRPGIKATQPTEI